MYRFSNNRYLGLFSVDLDNDNITEAFGDIKLTLNPDPNLAKSYQLSTDTEGVIRVWDDDTKPLVSIELKNQPQSSTENSFQSFEEGLTIEAELKTGHAEPNTDNPIHVNLIVDQGGEFIAFRVPRIVVMESNRKTLQIETLSNVINSKSGMM